MKGVKGSLSLSFVFITENGKLDENAKRIIFPSNYESLKKSVNKLYEKKYIVQSIYTSDGVLVDKDYKINPGDILIVSPNKPPPSLENQNDQKTISLYDEPHHDQQNEKIYFRDKKNNMSKERKQAFNQLFGSENQKTTQTHSNRYKHTKKSTTKKKKSNAISTPHNNYNSTQKEAQNMNLTNEGAQSKKQREKSAESFSSLNENKFQNNIENNINNSEFDNESKNSKNYNKRKDKNLNDTNQNQQLIHQVPPNLYSNLDNANFDNFEQFEEEEYYNQKIQNNNSEVSNQDNYNNNDNPSELDNSSLYNANKQNGNTNNSKYYFDTSEARDGDSLYKNSNYGDNVEDESSLCQISKEILNEDSFAQNIKTSLQLLDDEIMANFLRSGQALEDNQRNYWYSRCLKYFEEQKIGQHGNYMFAYDSMNQFVKDFISRHRFIIYPISNLTRNQKTRNNNNNNTNADDSSTATNANNSNINRNQIRYNIKTKTAICGPRKSGKSTLLAMMAEQLATEIAINGLWKNTVLYFLDMEECGPIFDDFKTLYLFFIEFSLKAIVLQRPELSPHCPMLVKFFGSIFDFTKAPKLKKIFSTKPQFQKFSLNCENLAIFFSQMWNNPDTHFLFFTSIFQIPSLLATAAGLTNVFLFIDNIEYSQAFIRDDIDFGQEINVYDSLALLLERVNYIITCEEQLEMFECLDSKTEIISTFQLKGQTQYKQTQLIVKYEFEQNEEISINMKRRKRDNDILISQPQQMILTSSFCGEIPAFVCLWEEINSIADEIDAANEKLDNEMNQRFEEEEDNFVIDEEKENEIDEMEEVYISLVQHFINDMVIDNEKGAKIKVIDVKRTNKQ